MIQSMIYGADVELVGWENGKAILVTHPSGQQFVIPLTAEQEAHVRRKLASDLIVPEIAEAG